MVKKNTQRGWKASLITLLKEHGRYSAQGNGVISFATMDGRKTDLFAIFNDLRNLGYKIQDVRNLNGKHVNALINHYTEAYKNGTLSANTLRKRFSNLTTFTKWIDKAGLVKLPMQFKRSSTPDRSKTWSDKGFDPLQKIEAIRKENQRIGDALALQLLFGLRSKESLLIQPHLADRKNVLVIDHGAKGGKTRYLPIENDAQRELLERIKSYIKLNESIIPPKENYISFRRKYYRLLQKHGISRDEGITAHGLRHERLNNLYEEVTGNKTPIRGGNLNSTNRELHKFACIKVSEEAGHSRRYTAGTYYIGTRKSFKPESRTEEKAISQPQTEK
jgi:integrase